LAVPARRRRWTTLALAASAGAVLLAGVLYAAGRGRDRTVTGKPVIAVLVMSVQPNDSALVWLADGLPQMIAGKLAHVTQVDVVNPTQVRGVVERSGNTMHQPIGDGAARDLARRVGATLVARGAISRDGGNLVLELTVNEVGSGDLVFTDVLTRNSALALADEAAARVLSNIDASGPQFAQLETSSVEAYQHYMRALEASQAGRLSDWRRELNAALALDSGFIPVLRARIGVAVGDYDTELVRRLRETLARHAARATRFDQAEQIVNDAFVAGERERSEALARDLVRQYPRDPRSYQTLQGILGSHGKFEEAARVAAQAVSLDSLTIEAGSGPCNACFGLGSVVSFAWARGDLRGAAEWARRWIRSQPDGPSAWAALAWTYSYLQRPDSALPLMQRAVSLSGGDIWATEEFARMLLVSRRYAAADSAISGMESSPSLGVRETAADLRSLLERELGRFRAAMRVLDRMVAMSPGSSGFAELVRADNLRLLGDYAGAARRYEAFTHPPYGGGPALPVPSTSARAFCWHHALAADALSFTGDTISLGATADTLKLGCSKSFYARDWRLEHHVRGLVAMRGERYADAEREFREAVYSPVEGWSRTVVELANAQAALGRWRDAIASLRTGYATRLNAMARYVPISELDYRMALTFAQAGEADSARVYAGYVRTAWRDADPEVRRLLTRLP
jgi:tetratricopeptide (TPR) repeat protein